MKDVTKQGNQHEIGVVLFPSGLVVFSSGKCLQQFDSSVFFISSSEQIEPIIV